MLIIICMILAWTFLPCCVLLPDDVHAMTMPWWPSTYSVHGGVSQHVACVNCLYSGGMFCHDLPVLILDVVLFVCLNTIVNTLLKYYDIYYFMYYSDNIYSCCVCVLCYSVCVLSTTYYIVCYCAVSVHMCIYLAIWHMCPVSPLCVFLCENMCVLIVCVCVWLCVRISMYYCVLLITMDKLLILTDDVFCVCVFIMFWYCMMV